jgi:hypothetical protein
MVKVRVEVKVRVKVRVKGGIYLRSGKTKRLGI